MGRTRQADPPAAAPRGHTGAAGPIRKRRRGVPRPLAARHAVGTGLRIEQAFEVARPVDAVYAYLTDPDRLPEWQKRTVEVRREASGPLTRGERLHEVHAAMGRRMESTVEVVEIDPPRVFALHVVDGPLPVDGRWTLEPSPAGTRVRFVGEGRPRGPMRLAAPLLRRGLDKQFRNHHARLKHALEDAPVLVHEQVGDRL